MSNVEYVLFSGMIMLTFALSLVAFAYMGFTLRRPLSRAFAWLVFAAYFGVTALYSALLFG